MSRVSACARRSHFIDSRHIKIHRLDGIADLIQTTKRGHSSLLGAACVIAVGLHELDVAAGARLGEFDKHAITIPGKAK